MLDLATMQRWQRAAQRALAADLPHRLRRRGRTVLVPSRSEAGVTYHVALSARNRVGPCDCPAALSGQPCAHRAAVAVRLYERATGVRVLALKPGSGLALERYL
jgi:uncharacterized Zn finger protein